MAPLKHHHTKQYLLLTEACVVLLSKVVWSLVIIIKSPQVFDHSCTKLFFPHNFSTILRMADIKLLWGKSVGGEEEKGEREKEQQLNLKNVNSDKLPYSTSLTQQYPRIRYSFLSFLYRKLSQHNQRLEFCFQLTVTKFLIYLAISLDLQIQSTSIGWNICYEIVGYE